MSELQDIRNLACEIRVLRGEYKKAKKRTKKSTSPLPNCKALKEKRTHHEIISLIATKIFSLLPEDKRIVTFDHYVIVRGLEIEDQTSPFLNINDLPVENATQYDIIQIEPGAPMVLFMDDYFTKSQRCTATRILALQLSTSPIDLDDALRGIERNINVEASHEGSELETIR